MKKLVFAFLLMVASIGASATNSIRFFTYSQVSRTVSYLNAQNELMIYCGYADELETYVILSDVWAEKINAKYYEVWIYGFDAYTGDEIYMPIDLSCIWLYSGTRYYSAASYLRFHSSVVLPSNFGWYMPEYNAFARRPHPIGMHRSYHYDVHCFGWAHPTPGHNPYGLPPYYCRPYNMPAPMPIGPWMPGHEKPIVISNGHSYLGGVRTGESNLPARTVNTRVVNPVPSGPASNGRGSGVNSGSSNGRGSSSNVNSSSSSGRGSGSNVNSSSSSGRGSNANVNSSSSSGRGSSSNVNSGSSSGRGSNANVNSGSSSGRGSNANVNSSSSSGRGSNANANSGSSSGRGSASSNSNGGTVNRGSSPDVYPNDNNGRGSSANSASSSSNSRGSANASSSSSNGRGSSAAKPAGSGAPRSANVSSSASSSSSSNGRGSSASASNGRGSSASSSSSSNGRGSSASSSSSSNGRGSASSNSGSSNGRGGNANSGSNNGR